MPARWILWLRHQVVRREAETLLGNGDEQPEPPTEDAPETDEPNTETRQSATEQEETPQDE
jgi:hypothetical protein